MAHIKLSNVTLRYPLRQNKGVTLKEFVLRHFLRKRTKSVHYFQALTDISCEIKEGERLGIIGFNGAGKSTLLRTIGGIYPITSGTLDVRGSICSLFDIHIGFETEATGEDNIYYRLYLEGCSPATVKKKIDSIVEFCELGEFIHMPLRTYSAGMAIRLGFSIATSGDPEILLIDEVFGAGDLTFQKKAEERMRDFMGRAKIVVMVGHHLNFLEKFCTRVLWIDKGQVKMGGTPQEIIGAYRQLAEAKKKAA
jgi:ABC-type polysaccharide/polyol phosphate transport system ATPase subunit